MGIVKLLGTLIADSSKAQESIGKTEEKAEGLGVKLGTGIKIAAKWGTALGNAAVGAGSAMMAAAGKVAGAAEEIDKESKRTGTDTETWQKLKYAMEESGIKADKLEASMIENQQALNKAASGVGEYSAAYNKLGVSIYDSSGQLRDADDVYQESLKALADMEDLNQRNALANQIFGKSYSDLSPILERGSEGIDDLTSRAEELGLVMSQQTVDAGTKFGETLDDLKLVGDAIFNMIAAELLPVLQVFLDWIIANAPKIQETVAGVIAFVQSIVLGFTEFWEENGEQIKQITSAIFEVVKVVIEEAINVIKGIIEYWLAIIRGDWEGAWNALVDVVSGILTAIGTLTQAGFEAIAMMIKGAGLTLYNAGKGALQSVWDGMKDKWESFSNWVSNKVSLLVDKLAFWQESEDEINDGAKKDSRQPRAHASGLAYVPYDRYPAELHRGEKVLTAEQAREYDERTSTDTQSGGDTYIFNSPKALTPAEARRQMQKARKELLLGF